MFLYIIYRIAQVIVMVLPLRFAYCFACFVADIHFYISRRDRNLVINNLKTVFGGADKKTRRIAREILRNFAKYLVEFLRFSRMGKTYFKEHVIVDGMDNLKRAFAAKKGVIMFSAHLGNWEWGAAIVAHLGYPISVISLAHKDRLVNNFFIKRRSIMGVKNIPLGGSVRKSLELLKNNEAIGILPDRDFSNNSVPVDFFGRTAYMPAGVGLFAVKTKCALLPTFVIREKERKYRMIFGKPLEHEFTGDRRADMKSIIQKTTDTIAKYVRLYPEQWFMFDNPWKKE